MPAPYRAALPLLLALLAPCATQAEGRRVALVIANSQYQHIDALRNPLADAQAVAERGSSGLGLNCCTRCGARTCRRI